MQAEVISKEGMRRLPGGRSLCRVLAGDDTATLTLSWFNTPYAAEKLEIGEKYFFEGIAGGSMLRRSMVNPLVRTAAQIAETPLAAVYGATEGPVSYTHLTLPTNREV